MNFAKFLRKPFLQNTHSGTAFELSILGSKKNIPLLLLHPKNIMGRSVGRIFIFIYLFIYLFICLIIYLFIYLLRGEKNVNPDLKCLSTDQLKL